VDFVGHGLCQIIEKVLGDHADESSAPFHLLTKVNHPRTKGQVERTNRDNQRSQVKRYYYQSHDHLKQHLHAFLMAYNFAKRLKTPRSDVLHST
jgi:hypothetical protein